MKRSKIFILAIFILAISFVGTKLITKIEADGPACYQVDVIAYGHLMCGYPYTDGQGVVHLAVWGDASQIGDNFTWCAGQSWPPHLCRQVSANPDWPMNPIIGYGSGNSYGNVYNPVWCSSDGCYDWTFSSTTPVWSVTGGCVSTSNPDQQ